MYPLSNMLAGEGDRAPSWPQAVPSGRELCDEKLCAGDGSPVSSRLSLASVPLCELVHLFDML